MTQIRTPRFWLLATAALVFGSHVSASAQNSLTYQSGAPTMVAAAPGLPSISPEQIARDVTSEFNPRTGAREFIAAPFDPFEEDPSLAASLRLRSADGMSAIDGRRLQDGAVVEIDFYYNSPSDDPYGGRNYSDARFVNGELAPVVLRDTRILECSTRVENVVYDHVNYYSPRYSSGVYRPYQHYTGHSGFGFGFGSSYFGPGYGYSSNRSYYGNSRSFGNSFVSGRNRSRSRRNETRRDRDRDRDARRDRQNEDRSTAENRDARDRNERANRNGLTEQQVRSRLNGVTSYGLGRSRNDARRNARASGAQPEVNSQPRIGVGSVAATRSAVQSSAASSTQTNTRRKRSEPRQTRQSEPRRVESRNNASRSESRNRQSRNDSNSRSNARPKKDSSSRSRRRISGNNIKRQLNFFPNDGYGGRRVVSTQSVDCAREDKLRVFISNARLDAARFDGLTLIALDAQGGETPIYLPPNYIEGFRIAATVRQSQFPGQVQAQPQSYQSAPQSAFVSPSNRIEAAPCPAGTSKQSDGTCLQAQQFGYPAR